jgi:poly(A) polymerase
MALSRERIADELLKLLGMPDPDTTVGVMLERGILRPVVPEIDPAWLPALEALIENERQAEVAPDPLRRFAALLPDDPALAEKIAVRLRFSNKARKRLACAVARDLSTSPRTLAYRLGAECAVDRLLLAGKAEEAAEIKAWKAPRLPIGGGSLIERGLKEGPIVARTLKTIEERWIEAGFPRGEAFDKIVQNALASAHAD